MIERRNGCFLFTPFLERGIIAGFSDRTVNQKAFCDAIGIPEHLVYFNQVHGTHIVRVTGAGREVKVSADAAVTEKAKIPLAVLTADCAPVFFADSERRIVGIAHAGWRGAHAGIVRQVIQKLQSDFGVKPEDLLVGIGPLIRSCCYEVGPEFVDRFGSHVQKRASQYFFDLAGFIREDLAACGIKTQSVFDSGFCTACEENLFFSYRMEGNETGRMISVIALRETPLRSN